MNYIIYNSNNPNQCLWQGNFLQNAKVAADIFASETKKKYTVWYIGEYYPSPCFCYSSDEGFKSITFTNLKGSIDFFMNYLCARDIPFDGMSSDESELAALIIMYGYGQRVTVNNRLILRFNLPQEKPKFLVSSDLFSEKILAEASSPSEAITAIERINSSQTGDNARFVVIARDPKPVWEAFRSNVVFDNYDGHQPTIYLRTKSFFEDCSGNHQDLYYDFYDAYVKGQDIKISEAHKDEVEFCKLAEKYGYGKIITRLYNKGTIITALRWNI